MLGFDDPGEPVWDTWKLAPGSEKWEEIPAVAAKLEPRGGFASCVLTDSQGVETAVISGGYGHLSGDLSEQKALPLTAGGAWSALPDVDHQYEPRSGATLTLLEGQDEGYLYGGFAGGLAVSDLFKCSIDDNGDLIMQPTASSDEQPPGRSAHAAVSLSDHGFFVFGGFGADGATDDLWVYVNEKWVCLGPSGDVPEPRSGHSLVALDSARFLLFGGVGADGRSFADLHVYDAEANTWQAVEAAGGPGPRYNHRAVVTGGVMVVTGGCVDEDGDGMGMGSATGGCFALGLPGA